MSREDIIRRIVERDVQKLGLSVELVLDEAPELHAAAREHFGTWETALHYAGISERRVSADYAFRKDRVLQRIRTLCLRGYDLSATLNLRRDRRLYEAARMHFGTWRKALQAAGINLRHARLSSKPRNVDRERIIKSLQQRHEADLSLAWHVICLENRAFAVAAKHTFRSWQRALVAAGLAPERTAAESFRRWDRESVLNAIKLRHESGKSLKGTRVRDEEASLMAAARRRFGSWAKAVAAAELTTE